MGRCCFDQSVPWQLVSALLMGICGLLIKKGNMTWLEQYALPISMLGAMALSIPISAWMR